MFDNSKKIEINGNIVDIEKLNIDELKRYLEEMNNKRKKIIENQNDYLSKIIE